MGQFIFYFTFQPNPEAQINYHKNHDKYPEKNYGFIVSHPTHSSPTLYDLADNIVEIYKCGLDKKFYHDYLTRPSPGIFSFGYNPLFPHTVESALEVLHAWQKLFTKNIPGIELEPIYELKSNSMVSDQQVLDALQQKSLEEKLGKVKSHLLTHTPMIDKPKGSTLKFHKTIKV